MNTAKFNGLGTAVVTTGLGKGRLNGWFGRILRSVIIKVAEMAASYVNTMTFGITAGLMNQLVQAANDIGSGGSEFWQRNMYEASTFETDVPGYDDELPMTAAEEAALLSWVDNNFQRFYNALLLRIVDNLTLADANKLVHEIIVVKSLCAFYKGKQDGVLSANATTNRSTIVNYLLNQQLKIVADKMTGFYQKNTVIIVGNYTQSLTVLGLNMSVLGSEIQGYEFTTEKTNTPVNTTTVTTPVSTTGVATLPGQTDNSKTKKIVGVGLIALAAVLLFSGKKSKK